MTVRTSPVTVTEQPPVSSTVKRTLFYVTPSSSNSVESTALLKGYESAVKNR
jgi:hypothetical protein